MGSRADREYLNPEDSTPIMGAYSHGVKVDIGDSELIFVTGQIAMDADGQAVAPGNFGKQAEFIFRNIKKILAEGGADLADIVKTTIYVTDIKAFPEVSAARNKYLAEAKPASTFVEIARTVKDGCEVEIEAMAIRKKNLPMEL